MENAMPYSDFTLKKVKQELKIKVIEDKDLFSPIKEVQVSDYLLTTLKYNMLYACPRLVQKKYAQNS
ncbi:MAG: hypothetical protein ABFS56_23710 [Pseudomonadota bacterium]